MNPKKLILASLVALALACGLNYAAEAASGDVAVLVRGIQSSARRDLLRMNSTFDLVPGVTAITDLGSSSLKFAAGYFSGAVSIAGNLKPLSYQHYSPLAITTNTTMTVADGSLALVGAVAGNTTIIIPSAVTAGSGYELIVADKGGVLDATHALAFTATAGNINGSASALAYSTAYGCKTFISDGSNWFAH